MKDEHTGGPISADVPGIDTKKIRQFCASHEVTTAAVIQTAWGLVLRQFTGLANPCFGILTSGRDMPIKDINDILGPMIGFIPCQGTS